MLTKKQAEEIKTHLEKAQNPVFFFDNDQDGLCSFLLLQRWIGRGKGVPVKSFPGLNKEYFRKIHEFMSDYIFILDKPTVSLEFFEEAEKYNMPVVYIDHHLIDKKTIPKFVNYYNPVFNKKKTSEPVTASCYQITKREEDMWLAVIGCIYDRFVPDFYKEFEKKYPDMSIKSKDAYDIFYKSQIGKITKIFGFGLKDRTSNVMNMLRFLRKVKSPYEILEENSQNKGMHSRFRYIDSRYNKLFLKALSLEKESSKFLFFRYSGDLSISSDLSNELMYLFPEKTIVVAYINGAKANISMRGKGSREIFLEAIRGFENATGGGHDVTIGGQIMAKDIERFRENLQKIIFQENY